MNNAEKIKKKLRWRDRITRGVAENICRPCTNPVKKDHKLNYDNPLQCGCKCSNVENILSNVMEIDADIKKLKH